MGISNMAFLNNFKERLYLNKQDWKQAKFLLAAVILFIAIIWGASLVSLNSINILTTAGYFSRWFPVFVILSAIVWRLFELYIKYITSDNDTYESKLNGIDAKIQSPIAQVICITISVLIFHCAVLGNQVGIHPFDGNLDSISSVGGELPFADAKMYYAASMSLPISGQLSTFASRRPVHASMLSFLNILSGFDHVKVLLLQATLVGIFLGMACLAIARWAGPSAAAVIWSLVTLLALDNVPSYMSAPTGMWLGAAAIYVLIASINRDVSFLIPLSICIFLLGFSARAGAFFIIPALIAIGFIATFRDKKKLKHYTIMLICSIGIAALFPVMVYSIFSTKGASYQANFSYILYDLAVDGKDWRQIRYDYPEKFKTLSQQQQATFIYQKAWDAFKYSPQTFPIAYIKRLKKSIYMFPFNHVEGMLINFLPKRRILKFGARGGILLSFVIFYGGLLFILLGNALSKSQKFTLLAILIGYAVSMPFIWLDGSMRYHAVGWILTTALFSAYLARRVTVSKTPIKSESASIIIALTVISVVYMSAIITAISAHFNHLEKLPNPVQDKYTNNHQGFTHYLILGPNTPYLHLISTTTRVIRPMIGVSEFYHTTRMKRKDQQKIIGPLKAGDTIFIGFDPRTNRHTIFITDMSLCIPSKNKLFIATSKWVTAPFVMKLEEIHPFNRKSRSIGKNDSILCKHHNS